MANTNNIISIENFGGGIKIAVRETEWTLTSCAPKSVDDLSFVGKDGKGRANWWTVIPPKTNYWHAHQILGRAYAFELLDLFNNPDAEYPEHILAYIHQGIRAWSRTVEPVAAEAIPFGFFEVLSEYLGNGKVAR